MTHTTYATSKAIKEFLGKEAPVPLRPRYFRKNGSYSKYDNNNMDGIPSYELHDLLSRPFCTAVAWRRSKKNHDWHANGISEILWGNFYEGGMEAVERTLMEIMEGK